MNLKKRMLCLKKELYSEIIGYLRGIANLVSFYGVCYGHSYRFLEYEYSSDINESLEAFLESGLVNRNKTIIKGLEQLADWKGEIFNSCSEWFFSLFSMQNFKITLEDENGYVIPAEKHRNSNYVVNELLCLLDEFFSGTDIIVYRLVTDPNNIDEFGWEEFFFDCGKKVYVLHFYQYG